MAQESITMTDIVTEEQDVSTLKTPARHDKVKTKPAPAEKDNRVHAQPGFVLHSYPHKETSLIVDMFTRDYGRIALVAKGAKRPTSKLRGVLQTFQPLAISWTGKSELKTLTTAEWVGGLLPLEKSALLSGFYLNELLVKLLAREDAHPNLFHHYVVTLNRLAHGEEPVIALRRFELALLKETGVASDWSLTSKGDPVVSNSAYIVDPVSGVRSARSVESLPTVAGKTLLDMENDDYSDMQTQQQSKLLMRALLAHHLGHAKLNTRQILIDLKQL